MLSFSSCKKSDKENGDDGYDKNVYGNHPRTENVPSALIGRWQYGVFSMTQYGNYSGGGYSGNAAEISNTYQLNADGTAIEFFYSANRGYYSVTEVLGKRFGTFTINEQNHTITFYAATGNYYQVYTVTGGTPQKDAVTEYQPGSDNLYPQYQRTYSYETKTDNQGKKILALQYPSGAWYDFTKMD